MTELNLKPVRYIKTSLINPAASKRPRTNVSEEQNADYRHRKDMSASVMRYLIEADAEKLRDMKVVLCDLLFYIHCLNSTFVHIIAVTDCINENVCSI